MHLPSIEVNGSVVWSVWSVAVGGASGMSTEGGPTVGPSAHMVFCLLRVSVDDVDVRGMSDVVDVVW